MLRTQNKVGRNQPCPCGSQKKFKRCCISDMQVTYSDEGEAYNISRNRLLDRMQGVTVSENTTQLSVSEAILHLAEDLLEAAQKKADKKMAIVMTCTAWNISIVVGDEGIESELEQLCKQVNVTAPDEKKELIEIMKGLIQKKKEFYPDVNRMVIDHELVESRGDLALNVASTPG